MDAGGGNHRPRPQSESSEGVGPCRVGDEVLGTSATQPTERLQLRRSSAPSKSSPRMPLTRAQCQRSQQQHEGTRKWTETPRPSSPVLRVPGHRHSAPPPKRGKDVRHPLLKTTADLSPPSPHPRLGSWLPSQAPTEGTAGPVFGWAGTRGGGGGGGGGGGRASLTTNERRSQSNDTNEAASNSPRSLPSGVR